MQVCREVCKLWCKEAVRTLGFRLRIDLSDAENVKDVLKKVKEQMLQVAELSVFDLDLNEKSFQELFFLASPTLAVFRIFDSEVTPSQWQKLMRRARYLVRMEIGTLRDGDSPIKTFPVFSSGHQIVQYQHLQYLEFLPTKTPQPVLLSEIIRSCPNLKKLVTANFMKEDPKNFDGLELPKLEKLDIAVVSGLLMECLLKLNLSVKVLQLSNFVMELSPSLIRKFIESQGDSLNNLILTQGRTEEDPFVEQVPCCPFPFVLPNLSSLEVEKPFVRNMSHVINGTSFPNLRHVFLRFDPGSNWERCLPKNLKSHDGVSHLSIEWIEEKPLIQMAKAFPNLKQLDIGYCDDKLLRIIFTHLPTLEFLSVEDSEYRVITDEGLTGYPEGCDDSSERVWPYVGSLKSKCASSCTNQLHCVKWKLIQFLPSDLHLLSLDFKFHPATEKSILKGICEVTSLKVLRIYGMPVSLTFENEHRFS